MKSLKLDMENMEGDFFDGSRLLGIVAPLKGYRFCWQLNRQMRLDFQNNQPDRNSDDQKKKTILFYCI